MFIKRLELTNFRLFDKISLEFANEINLITGRNGCGKTSILESIYFLALTKSFRTSKDFQIKKYQQESFIINGHVISNSGKKSMTRIYYSEKEGKHMFQNNKEVMRYSDYIGFLPCVLLQPEDIKLTLGAPADRRRFLDILLSQISPVYLEDLRVYKRVLIQRNALLSSEGNSDLDKQIEIWDKQLINHGARIIQKRLAFTKFLNNNLENYYNNFSRKNNKIRVEYHSNILIKNDEVNGEAVNKLFEKKLSMLFKYELLKKTTIAGPHRDDIYFYKDGKLFKDYASQGENKSLIIALKLLEWNYLSQTHTSRPVLLFDDIFGELDPTRMEGLLEFLKDVGQTFITTTLSSKFPTGSTNKEIRLEEIVDGYA